MNRFERSGACSDCGGEYRVAGSSLNPGVETEAPVRLRCPCGGWLSVFVPGSVNTERLVLTPSREGRPRPG